MQNVRVKDQLTIFISVQTFTPSLFPPLPLTTSTLNRHRHTHTDCTALTFDRFLPEAATPLPRPHEAVKETSVAFVWVHVQVVYAGGGVLHAVQAVDVLLLSQ